MSLGPQQPYASPTPGSFGPEPAKKGWSMGCIFGIIAAVVIGGGGLLCCGGGTGLFFFGLNTLNAQMEKELKANAVVAEHLGEVKKITYNMQATGERHTPGSNKFVFDVEGTKGKGQVDVQCSQDLRIMSGTLKTPAGTEVQLVPGGGSPFGAPGVPGMPGGPPGGPGGPRF